MTGLPPLIDKALIDAGYDLVEPVSDGWFRARVSGTTPGAVWVKPDAAGTLLSVGVPDAATRIGLATSTGSFPGAASTGLARTPSQLLAGLRLLRTLVTRPAGRLSAEVEARLAKIPATERTQEVRTRIGQDVYRDALMEFWEGRCALSGVALPNALLRASHAKPWKDASDAERLDPFNGLLLAVRYDALFDQGLIAFADDGQVLISPALSAEVRAFVALTDTMRLRSVLPGHLPYLRYHREHVARFPVG